MFSTFASINLNSNLSKNQKLALTPSVGAFMSHCLVKRSVTIASANVILRTANNRSTLINRDSNEFYIAFAFTTKKQTNSPF